MSGVPIPRETQARWFIKGALEYLDPIYSRLHEELLRRDLIHADEVPCQVLHEDGRKATQKSLHVDLSKWKRWEASSGTV